MKKIGLLFFCFVTMIAASQNYGRVIIYTNLNQPFIASLNGVRISNNLDTKFTFEYVEDPNNQLKVWFQNAQFPINFNLQNSAGYESVYLINKDKYGAYALNLVSKVVFSASSSSGSVVTTPTTTMPPSNNVLTIMSESDFNQRLEAVKKESFDDAKLTKAKFVFASEYFSSEQVARVIPLFSFDSKKVDFAKFAYKKTLDKNNYFKVVDALTFDSYKKELQNWITKNP